MACGYCHNPELVRGVLKKLPMEKIEKFLQSRMGLLEGVVLSGGECTLYRALPDFAAYLKKMGYKVKVDTNGSNPEMIANMIDQGLIDFVALDFKATPEKFLQVTNFEGYDKFYRTLSLLASSNIQHEIRTTIHTRFLNEDDVNRMIGLLEKINYKGTCYLQKFRDCETLGNIGAQTRKFDLSAIRSPSFNLELRGF